MIYVLRVEELDLCVEYIFITLLFNYGLAYEKDFGDKGVVFCEFCWEVFSVDWVLEDKRVKKLAVWVESVLSSWY